MQVNNTSSSSTLKEKCSYIKKKKRLSHYKFRALQFPPEAWLRMSLHNSSITWIAIRPSGRVVLRALGDCGHLPPDKLTTTWIKSSSSRLNWNNFFFHWRPPTTIQTERRRNTNKNTIELIFLLLLLLDTLLFFRTNRVIFSNFFFCDHWVAI